MYHQDVLESIIREARDVLLEVSPPAHTKLEHTTALHIRRLMGISIVQDAALQADTFPAFVIRRITLIVRDDARSPSEMVREMRTVFLDEALDALLGTAIISTRKITRQKR